MHPNRPTNMDRLLPITTAFNCLLLLSLFVACRPSSGQIPRLTVGAVVGMPTSDPEVPLILESLQRLLLLVEQGKLEQLPGMVSENKGIYVDLKSHRKRADLAGEIADKKSYLPMYYLDTRALRKSTGDENQLSIRDVLRTTREIKVDFFRESDDECELKLHLVDNLEASYRLNNPVFIRENGAWLVYRLF